MGLYPYSAARAVLTLISSALTAWGAPAIYYSDLQSEEDSTPRYYDKTFDLDQLDSVDLIASYWMGPAIAHIFVSFGFRACRSRSLESTPGSTWRRTPRPGVSIEKARAVSNRLMKPIRFLTNRGTDVHAKDDT